MIQMLKTLKEKRIGQNEENLKDLCINCKNWDERAYNEHVNIAVEHKVLRKVIFQGKISYRSILNQNIVIRDAVKNIATQTEPEPYVTSANDKLSLNDTECFYNDFRDFKEYVCDRLAEITPQETAAFQGTDKDMNESRLIESLQNHIKSLELQLNDKRKL